MNGTYLCNELNANNLILHNSISAPQTNPTQGTIFVDNNNDPFYRFQSNGSIVPLIETIPFEKSGSLIRQNPLTTTYTDSFLFGDTTNEHLPTDPEYTEFSYVYNETIVGSLLAGTSEGDQFYINRGVGNSLFGSRRSNSPGPDTSSSNIVHTGTDNFVNGNSNMIFMSGVENIPGTGNRLSIIGGNNNSLSSATNCAICSGSNITPFLSSSNSPYLAGQGIFNISPGGPNNSRCAVSGAAHGIAGRVVNSMVFSGFDNNITSLTGGDQNLCTITGRQNTCTGSNNILMAGLNNNGGNIYAGRSNLSNNSNMVGCGANNSSFNSGASAVIAGNINRTVFRVDGSAILCGILNRIWGGPGTMFGNIIINGGSNQKGIQSGGTAGIVNDGVYLGVNNNIRTISHNSVVIGQNNNSISASHSVLLGNSATGRPGSFVFSGSDPTPAIANNSFTAKCYGGAHIYTDSGILTGVALMPNDTSWGTPSDVNIKENLIEIDYNSMIEKIKSLKIYNYNYKWHSPDNVNIGPMADEWYKLYPTEKDQTRLSTLDLDGVAISTLKGLYKKYLENKRKIQKLVELLK